LLARALGMRDGVAAVMCFGLVLKGETSHDFHIASSVSHALQDAAFACDKPMLFGVLTCESLEQARARALPTEQGGELDKGREVARAAVAALVARKSIDGIGGLRRAGFFSHLGEARS
jgi:6,7-dimethyl-8-ribityllumazine synthase